MIYVSVTVLGSVEKKRVQEQKDKVGRWEEGRRRRRRKEEEEVEEEEAEQEDVEEK